MARSRKKLGEYLVRWGVINEDQLKEALRIQKSTNKRTGEVLVELGYCSGNDVAKALAAQFDLEHVDLDEQRELRKNAELMPRDLIKKYLVLPVSKENGRLKIAVHDPMDLELMDVLRFRLNAQIDVAIASRAQIKEYIDTIFSETQESIDKAVRELSMDRGMSLDASLDRGMSLDASIDRGISMDRGVSIDQEAGGGAAQEESNAPVVRLVQRIIQEAVIQRASDIHVEPMADRVRLRYRVDGVCHERDNIPKRTQGAMITRLKILSGMKIDERRVPQDGRIKMRVEGQQIDFRVSSCPAYHGESIVLRILRPDAVRIGLKQLGFEQDTLDEFHKAIRRPNGIFLVTGPTGSGKTTTLYSALDELNRPDRKIITAEDPVEYNFSGINQCQVRESIGLSFSNVLRAMLRQAPNIILVGEIRDKEVADVAIQAALTGHLVFSTLHTNDAPSAITRLIDMGVKPFLVASSIQAVMAQRLIRVLCGDCKTADENPNRFQMRLIGMTDEDLKDHTVYKAVGCPACSNTGYRGRQGIYEYMTMNSELRELAFKRAPSVQLRQAAIASGMRTLAGDGRHKVLGGVTSVEEIARVAQVEGLVAADDEEEL